MYKVTAEYSLGRRAEFITPDYYLEGEPIWNDDFKESGVITKVEYQKLLTEDVALEELHGQPFQPIPHYDTTFPKLEAWRDRVLRDYLTPKDHEFLKGMNVRWE